MLLVSIIFVSSVLCTSWVAIAYKFMYLSGYSYLYLLDYRLPLRARGSTIYHAFLMLHATFMMALLLMMLGRPLIYLKSCASVRSMSSLFHRPAATIEVAMYTRMLLASTHVRVSLMTESTILSFNFR